MIVYHQNTGKQFADDTAIVTALEGDNHILSTHSQNGHHGQV